MAKAYDVIVVGGGHAGIEAALAASRLGCSVLLLTMNPDTLGMMSCNPAIGGLAKGQIVREIDALGGAMARNIDETGIQFRMLNTAKGPAVQSPRAQADKMAYAARMRRVIEEDPHINLAMDTVKGLIMEQGRAAGVRGSYEEFYRGRSVVITPGTFLRGRLHIGDRIFSGGRLGEHPADGLGEALKELGLPMGRLKTGTPARVDGKSLDYSRMEPQKGDDPPRPFSFRTERLSLEQVPCFKTHTREKTHDIIRKNLKLSALFSGNITGIGPRYCPSIEDKVKKFPDRDSHLIFVEPEGRYTTEMYLNGISSSLPAEIQEEFIHTIEGLEKARIVRYAYAVEYDYVAPYILRETLEVRDIPGLFLAGQINGTSGYEEAAAQGLMAGANAALGVLDKPPFILRRDEAYIGVLIDDLITKGADEPYRMFTSRAEYRLLLRSDNADRRLVPRAAEIGLVDKGFLDAVKEKYEKCENLVSILRKESLKTDHAEWKRFNGRKLFDLLKVREMDMETLLSLSALEGDWEGDVLESVAIEAKYDGYIARALADIRKFKKMEEMRLPSSFDYRGIKGLTSEAAEKLNRYRPSSVGMASRISGISPADISVLIVYFSRKEEP
ncbi:MAG TPA: tRNA uridine-5-carboxymethylaminomethyl(34) synthesis enzyme MnmG [Candidatus Mcinerneyibacteriales bacterium]|jgi:tRNA uridine 5-carboxymethylaminomethyl modification enzyme|nr:tRNA uridine-5-carboxymethylaminomethyl(34) synthesis enzyme MnmG [Candidatus Mcinerneyibacteriales bacterium]